MAESESGGGRAAVLGGGTMGAGIAQVLLEAGCEVVIVEADTDAAERARARVADGLGRRKNVAPEELETGVDPAGAVGAGGEEIERVVHQGNR